jgi:hypothetical protein
MPITDLIIWYLAIYGMAWTIVYGKIMDPYHGWISQKYIKEGKYSFLFKLTRCIVCVSFWCAAIFVNHYFAPETWITKLLVVFSNVAFTWFLANKYKDLDE